MRLSKLFDHFLNYYPMSHLTLVRKTQHIFSYVNLSYPPADEVQQEVLHAFTHLHNIFPDWMICTCKLSYAGLFFISNNSKAILGFEPGYFANLSLEQFFGRIHPDDIAEYYTCMKLIDQLLQKEDPAVHHKFRFVFHHRWLHASGRYLHIHFEKACMLLKNNQVLQYSLVRNITQQSPFRGVKIVAFNEDEPGIKLLEYAASEDTVKLSRRESQLIPLMRQGLSVKEIAGYLAISPHTVRNMRQKLFEKFQVNNAIELLNKVSMPAAHHHEQQLAVAG